MTNREKFTEIFGCEIAQHDTGEAIPGHCKILIASDNHFNEWLKQEYVPSAQLAQDLPKSCTDTISRQAASEAVCKMMKNCFNATDEMIESVKITVGELPTAEPETAKRIVGKSRDGMTLWYQCDMCNEPVDVQDNYCSGCGRRLIDERSD